MARVEVVIREHEHEFRYVIVEDRSLDDLRDLLERLKAHFGDDGQQIQVLEE